MQNSRIANSFLNIDHHVGSVIFKLEIGGKHRTSPDVISIVSCKKSHDEFTYKGSKGEV